MQALSNQKYREMYEQFKDVGLMTGDVTINPSASCIVMTTEVGVADGGQKNWINSLRTDCCLLCCHDSRWRIGMKGVGKEFNCVIVPRHLQ